jgi:uncharacterized protein YxeA
MKSILFIIFILISVAIILYICNIRYDPLYPFLNKKRDPENFRRRAFFKKKFYKEKTKRKEPGFKIIKKYNFDENDQNIISYSLYGNNPKYFNPVHDNIDIVKKNLPDWKIRIYLHENVLDEFRDKLIKTGMQVFIVQDSIVKPGNSSGAFWRFLPLCEDINCVIYDADDLINEKQIKRINNFFKQSKYLIRTSWTWPWPKNHVMGGIIYKKKGLHLPFDTEYIMNYPHRSTFGSDEIFLTIKFGDMLDKKIWDRSNDFSNRFNSIFVRDHVIKNN